MSRSALHCQQRHPCTYCKFAQRCATRGHPVPLPQVTSGSVHGVQSRGNAARDKQTRVTNIHSPRLRLTRSVITKTISKDRRRTGIIRERNVRRTTQGKHRPSYENRCNWICRCVRRVGPIHYCLYSHASAADIRLKSARFMRHLYRAFCRRGFDVAGILELEVDHVTTQLRRRDRLGGFSCAVQYLRGGYK